MKIPVSWLKDYVNINISIEKLASMLTLAGLEVEEIRYVGWEMPKYEDGASHEFKTYGLEWDREKLVVAEISEVKAHPNADKLVLCDLYDGKKKLGSPHRRTKSLSVQRKRKIRKNAQSCLCQRRNGAIRWP